MPLVLRSRRIFFLGGFPPKRPRINTGQSGGSGDGSPPVGSRGIAPAGSQKLKVFKYLHTILKQIKVHDIVC